MEKNNIIFYEEDYSRVKEFNSFIENRYPNFKIDADIFDNAYYRAIKNTHGLSQHEQVFEALKGFLEKNSKDETESEKPIVIYDAFFLFDEGKNVSELYECMLKTNRPIFIHVPRGFINK